MKRDRRYTHTSARGLRIGKVKGFPVFSLLTSILLLGGVGFLFVWFGLPFMNNTIAAAPNMSCLGSEQGEEIESPEPTVSPLPAGAERPLFSTDLRKAQQEWMMPDRQYLTDVSVAGNTLVAAAGDYYAPDGTAAFVRVALRDIPTKYNSQIEVPMLYQNIRFPRLLGSTLVYLDVKGAGGGRLMAYDTISTEEKELKTIHMGVPYLTAEGNAVCWIERTGTTRFKLFACDVTSGESVTIALSDNAQFGASRPSLQGGLLVWTEGSGKLCTLNLSDGEREERQLSVAVHDPQTNGKQIAFLSGMHGTGTDLYILEKDGTPLCAAKDVADFRIAEGFVAYNTGEKNYIRFFSDGSTFCITRESERVLLLAAGGSYVVWQNVIWRERDILEYMAVE